MLPLLFVLDLMAGVLFPAAMAQETAIMRQTLKEAADLQENELPKVSQKLLPLLSELRDRFGRHVLTPETLSIYQDALLLHMRTQSKLLVDEAGIAAIVREMLTANPRMDDSVFNPREKLLIEKIRSAETGRLGLQSTPAGADLTYFGMPLGTTPVDIPLIAGTYHLRLSKDGYRDEEFDATIRPAEMLSLERPLRRRALQVPISIKAPAARVNTNGSSAGVSREYDSWLASLTPQQTSALQQGPAGWNPDRRSLSFLLLTDVPVGEPLSLELRADCYVARTLSLTIPEAEIDWDRPLTIVPELLNIELKRDTGTLDISSTPTGATVLLDGVSRGTTPTTIDACSGTHRVQVVHRAGQYVRSVLVKRDESAKVSGDLKPALAFLGVYSSSAGRLTPSLQDWEPVGAYLSASVTAFCDPQLSSEKSALQQNVSAPIAVLAAAGEATQAAEAALAHLFSSPERPDLLLFGVRSGDAIIFRLYSSAAAAPDVIEIPNVQSASLEFLAAQINGAGKTASWLQSPHLDLELLQSPRGLVVLKDMRPNAEMRPPLVPGVIIRSVDQKPMDYAELQSYLRTRREGQSITLELTTGKENTSLVLPIRFAGSEYPWSAPQGFPNAIMTTLRHIVEREPGSRLAQLARLSLARGLMQRAAWKSAVEVLEKTDLEPVRSGVSQGTVLYYQGRCREELQDSAQALALYTRAADYPDATLGTVDGMPISELVQRRLQALKKPTQ